MSDINFQSAIDLILKASAEGNPKHEFLCHVGPTPSLLIGFGLPDLPLVMTGRTIDKIHFDHGLPKGVIERVHGLISAPKKIFKSAPPHKDGSVIVTFETHRGDPVIVSIRAAKQFGRTLVANEITSMYAKEGVDYEKWWVSDGLLLWKK